MKKQTHFWNGLRARKSEGHDGEYTPIKRMTDVTNGTNKRLVINTEKKSPGIVARTTTEALSKAHKRKGIYLTANEDVNCAFLWDKLGDSLSILRNIKIPSSILSKTYTKEITINLKKRSLVKRLSANSVRKRTAKADFQTALAVIMKSDEIKDSDKQIFEAFFKLYDKKMKTNKKIPCAEWCRMIAMSLSGNTIDAMASDNLFAATAMVNTKMINFENSAKRLARDDYVVKLKTSYATFKGTATLAQLLQNLTVTDKRGREYSFEQAINPFDVNDVVRSTSVHDPDHVYNYIVNSIQERDNSMPASHRMLLRFSSGETSRRKIIFYRANTPPRKRQLLS